MRKAGGVRHKQGLAIRVAVIVLIGALVYVFSSQGFGRYLTLESLKQNQQLLHDYSVNNAFTLALGYVLVYVALAMLSLPGAALLTVAGGAIFGVVTGTFLVSIASTVGATLAFLASRFLFRDAIRARFAGKLEKIDEGVRREGAFYLFSLRLVPIFPFFLINLLMGLTPIRTFTFFWVSQVGMLPGTVAFVNAGTQLSRIETLSGVLSPAFLSSFVVIGLLPIVSKKLVGLLKSRKSGRHA